MNVSRPGVMETIKLLPLARRVGSYVYSEHRAGRTPIFDLNGITLSPPIPRPYAGVPCGGVGGGAIGRGVRGEFRRWSVTPGRYRHSVVAADVFSARVEGEDLDCKSTVLSVEPLGEIPTSLKGWDWGTENGMEGRTTYHALFPRSWTVYNDPTGTGSGVTVIEKQISPFIPDNYSDTSLPCTTFEFTIENSSSSPRTVSLMFTFENTDGGDAKDEAEHESLGGSQGDQRRKSSFFHSSSTQGVAGVKGVAMSHSRRRRIAYVKGEGGGANAVDVPVCGCAKMGWEQEEYTERVGIAVGAERKEGVEVSARRAFDPDDVMGAGEVWEEFNSTGGLGGEEFNRETGTLGTNGRQAAAVCQKVTVPAGESRTVAFSLSWDSPEAHFGSGEKLPRRHSLFFPQSASGSTVMSNAAALSAIALTRYMTWDSLTDEWQKPYVDDPELPEWFKGQLLNELYYLVDGGCVWVDAEDGVRNDRGAYKYKGLEGRGSEVEVGSVGELAKSAMSKMEDFAKGNGSGDQKDVGSFLYLEGHEYVMYNTSDVHFYASFALSRLLPSLCASITRDYATSVFKVDGEIRKLLGEGEWARRKVEGAVVHDMGSPSESPVNKVNAYNFQDVSRWKDLPCKLVLMAVRDAEVMGEGGERRAFVDAVWPACELAIKRAGEMWDKQGDGMIKNEGFPDQTYDVWIADGVSAYTGGLWVAALFGMGKLADVKGLDGEVYRERGRRGKEVYGRLWNGSYFSYSEKGKKTRANCDSVMADQMCGHWWSMVCGLEEVVSKDRAVSSLKKVHEMNVVRWGEIMGFKNGAVNGMKKDGEAVDDSCLQSKEVWTGTTYAVASAMLRQAGVEGVGEEDRRMLKEAAFDTAKGVWEAGWKRFGYSFATPEAWDAHGHYRSLGYMRPLCIWGMVEGKGKKGGE